MGLDPVPSDRHATGMKYLSLLCLALGMAGGARGADDLATARNQLCALQEESVPPADAVRKLMATLKPDGSWPDVDYANKYRGRWLTFQHLDHVHPVHAGLGGRNRTTGRGDHGFRG